MGGPQKMPVMARDHINLYFDNHNYSYGELAYFQDYFERLGRRYGLIKEFKENAII